MAYYLPSLVLLGVLVIGIPHVLGITDGRQTIEVKAGEDVFLSCEYDNIRSYIWERNNRSVGDISINRDHRLYVVRGRGLVILNAEQTDEGIFVCTVVVGRRVSEKVYELRVVAREESAEDIRCGYVNQRNRIIGGRDVNAPGRFPWMVLLWHKTYNAPFCGGALLSRRFVVTAAHCFIDTGYGSDEVQVKLGEFDTSITEPYERTIDIAQIISHDQYRPHVTFDSDILLLRLAEPVAYSDYIVPICLPSEMRGEALLATGTQGTVAGWGQTDTEIQTHSNILKKAKLTIRDFQTCGSQHTNILTNNMFCALGGRRQGNIRDACHGDSGGPFIVEENDRSYLVGIVSWGMGCGNVDSPGVYTRVSRFRSWILENINTDFQSCEDIFFKTREDLNQALSKIQALEEQVELLSSQLDQDTFVCTTPSPPVTTLAPYQDISIPCRRGACWHVGGYRVWAQCINGICECNSPHYNTVTCLPNVGSCDIRENDPSNNHAVPLDSSGSIPSSVYSCVGEVGRTSDVHVLGVYEGNVHTRPPTAGTMNVRISPSASTRTVVLVFASYEPVEWVLDLPESLAIEKVILISYYVQHSSVRLADGITREAPTVDKKPRHSPRGYGKDNGGGNTAGMILGLSQIYGSVTSFAGTYKADAWNWTLPVGTSSSSTLETVGDSGSLPGSHVNVNENTWTEYSYRSTNNWNSCRGTKYVRKRPNMDGQIGQFVGATLCDSNSRYKLFMSDDLNGVFQDIADTSGHGQDHCEFVGAPSDGEFNLDSSFWHSPSADGYYRSNWGDDMQQGQIGGGMGPTWTGRYYPKWYECGVTIP